MAAKTLINKGVEGLTSLSKGGCMQQLAVGTVAGWTTGYFTAKVGRPVCFLSGCSVILLQIAQHRGLLKTDWEKMSAKSKELTDKIEMENVVNKTKNLACERTCFSAGFVGGFLIGIAT